jgi:MFS family permease
MPVEEGRRTGQDPELPSPDSRATPLAAERSSSASDDWRLRLATIAMTVGAAHLSLNLYSGSLSLYLHRNLGLSLFAVGLAVGVAYVVQVAATLVAGPVIDRWGPKVALQIGPALYLVASLAFLATSNPVGIVVARVLQGAGIALILPAAFATIPVLVPLRVRGLSLGLLGLFQSMALAIGPQLGIWLLARSPTLLFSSAAVAAAVSVTLGLRVRVRKTSAGRSRLLQFRREWTAVLLLTLLTVVYWGVVVAYLPIHVPASEVTSVAWFFTADALGVLICRIPVGFLSDRIDSWRLLVLGTIVSAASVLLIALPPTLVGLVVAGLGTGIGSGLLIAPSLVELQNRSDDSNRGTAMALWATNFAAGVATGTIIGAPLISWIGFNATVIATAVVCLLALPACLRLRPQPMTNASRPA